MCELYYDTLDRYFATLDRVIEIELSCTSSEIRTAQALADRAMRELGFTNDGLGYRIKYLEQVEKQLLAYTKTYSCNKER